MQALDSLQAQVADTSGVIESAVVLIEGLASIIAQNAQRIDDLARALADTSAALARALAAHPATFFESVSLIDEGAPVATGGSAVPVVPLVQAGS